MRSRDEFKALIWKKEGEYRERQRQKRRTALFSVFPAAACFALCIFLNGSGLSLRDGGCTAVEMKYAVDAGMIITSENETRITDPQTLEILFAYFNRYMSDLTEGEEQSSWLLSGSSGTCVTSPNAQGELAPIRYSLTFTCKDGTALSYEYKEGGCLRMGGGWITIDEKEAEELENLLEGLIGG